MNFERGVGNTKSTLQTQNQLYILFIVGTIVIEEPEIYSLNHIFHVTCLCDSMQKVQLEIFLLWISIKQQKQTLISAHIQITFHRPTATTQTNNMWPHKTLATSTIDYTEASSLLGLSEVSSSSPLPVS